MRKIYLACMSIFALTAAARFALHLYWHAKNPHLPPMHAHILEWLLLAQCVFLVVGMLAWAQTWRDWK